MTMKNILPQKVKTKIYKTGQTRGADDDVIYQNRVGRNSTVLIPFDDYEICKNAPTNLGVYENGFIVLIKPEDYFQRSSTSPKRLKGLRLGTNLLVYYETREQWEKYPPLRHWKEATSRIAPLGGHYVARIPATTADGAMKIVRGFCTSTQKGAGIRVYEYADADTIRLCKLQLEYLFWQCEDAAATIKKEKDVDEEELNMYLKRLNENAIRCGVADHNKLIAARIIDREGFTICPLCLKRLSAKGFWSKIQQAEGREVPDLTVTEVSLFHIRELRTGEYNHRLYNLGWGHHHCNVVVKDSGIEQTLAWMRSVIARNDIANQLK